MSSSQQEHGGQDREARVKAPGVSESPTRCVEELSRVQVRSLLWWCEFITKCAPADTEPVIRLCKYSQTLSFDQGEKQHSTRGGWREKEGGGGEDAIFVVNDKTPRISHSHVIRVSPLCPGLTVRGSDDLHMVELQLRMNAANLLTVATKCKMCWAGQRSYDNGS